VRHPGFRERLTPPLWAWLVVLGFSVMVGAAYGAAIGAPAGWAAAAAIGLGGISLLAATSPRIEVADGELRAAGATLPLVFIASAEALDAARTRSERNRDARLFVVLRSWSSAESVLVHLNDPADPHPGWLLTSRRPQALVEALTVA
jgi:hypothetical protein